MSRWGGKAWNGVKRSGNFSLRVCLALSAYKFQRGYWFGGVLVAVSLLLTNEEMAQEAPMLAKLLASERIVYVLMGVLAAPIFCTIVSEVAFFARWRFGRRERGEDSVQMRFVPTETHRDETNPVYGGAWDKSLSRSKEEYFIPTTAVTGGVKQIIQCHVNRTFQSHIMGYVPYSVKIKTGLAQSHLRHDRYIVLARRNEILDFEDNKKSFETIGVCDGCWILCRIRDKADASPGGAADVD